MMMMMMMMHVAKAILQHLLNMDEIITANRVSLYLSVPHKEVDTMRLIEELTLSGMQASIVMISHLRQADIYTYHH